MKGYSRRFCPPHGAVLRATGYPRRIPPTPTAKCAGVSRALPDRRSKPAAQGGSSSFYDFPLEESVKADYAARLKHGQSRSRGVRCLTSEDSKPNRARPVASHEQSHFPHEQSQCGRALPVLAGEPDLLFWRINLLLGGKFAGLREFLKFPVKFPVLREFAASDAARENKKEILRDTLSSVSRYLNGRLKNRDPARP